MAGTIYGTSEMRQNQHFVPPVGPPSTSGEPDGRADATTRKASQAAVGRRAHRPCNLDRFLEATTPRVSAQYLSKAMRGWGSQDEESSAYFRLGDLWESFREWSAYGAGVPLLLNGIDSAVQYYVPYLSGIQLYANLSTHLLDSRDPVEDSDVDSFKDSSSDVSSDSELEIGMKYSGNWCKNGRASCCMIGMEKLSNEKHIRPQEEFSSDDSDGGESHSSLIFEYLEYDRPYCREPLADKVADLAKQFPALKTIKSSELLPASWFSVAWYPIYRIPTGPTLRDLDACFLTFHRLSTPMIDTVQESPKNKKYGVYGVPKICLPVFGLASYKFRNSMWTSSSGCDGKLVNMLLEAADKWLRVLNANLPDYRFFASQNTYRR